MIERLKEYFRYDMEFITKDDLYVFGFVALICIQVSVYFIFFH